MGKKVIRAIAVALPLIVAMVEGFAHFRKTGDRVQLIVYPAAVLLFLAVWAVRKFAHAQKRNASQSWATTSGTIESLQAEETGRDTALLSLYELNVAYSYRVQGEWYSGFEMWKFRDENEADAAQRELKGRGVVVRYNPRNPASSTLSQLPMKPDGGIYGEMSLDAARKRGSLQ